ncbi:MAG: oxaloacetate decarboxylase [Proteobacteria bacterium]|nr:oxaloacetate decarboxylase [Pseudomonadota bacterium]MBU1695823.1 oxaloacetate decarboxylase [Pseudomonadota bacterium]
MRKTTLFKKLILDPEILMMPVPHDVLSAKILEQIGFKSLCVGGYAASATLLGQPDISLLSVTEMIDHFFRMVEAVDIPVFVDGDTGHGGVHNIRRMIKQIEKAGAAGIFIEDQVFPKRCGHMADKAVISTKEMVAKLKAALDARIDPDFCIMARTDAIAVHGIEDAIERACQYRETGADLIFVEAPQTIEDMKRINREINAPTLANIIEGGRTPEISVKELETMGFNAVTYPTTATYTVAKAIFEVMGELYSSGSTDKVRHRMFSFDEFNELVGLSSLRELEKKYI